MNASPMLPDQRLLNLLDVDRIKTEIAARNLHDFVRQSWHVIEPTSPLSDGWYLGAICDHLQAVSSGQIQNLVINVPPRHTKSTTISVMWPAWEWITHPELRWLFSSYAASLATRDSVKCRRLISSPWYQQRWGHKYRLTDDQNLKMRFENDKTGYRIATSVTGSATGEGGDRIVADDPHKASETKSDLKRQGVLDWWDGTMSTRGNNPASVAKVIVMQRLHEDDLAGHVLERGGWELLCLPARYEGPRSFTSLGWQDPRRVEGEILDPNRFTEEKLREIERDLGPYDKAAQLQQRPSPLEGGIIKRSWWRYWSIAPQYAEPVRVKIAKESGEADWLDLMPVKLPDHFDSVFQSWDMAFKNTVGSSFVCGQVWGLSGANRFLLHERRGKYSFTETLSAVRETTLTYPGCNAILVEDKANGPAVIDTLRNELSALVPITPDGSKEARLHAESPTVFAGNVFLPSPNEADWVEDWIIELTLAPNGRYNDRADSFSQAQRWVRVGGAGGLGRSSFTGQPAGARRRLVSISGGRVAVR